MRVREGTLYKYINRDAGTTKASSKNNMSTDVQNILDLQMYKIFGLLTGNMSTDVQNIWTINR